MKINIKNKLIILFLSFSGFLFAEKDEITIPAKVTVDPYVQLLLTSSAFEIDIVGNPIDKAVKELTPGSLFFGSMFKAKKHELTKSHYSYNYISKTDVKIINNSKPFQLILSIVPTDKTGFIIDLETLDKTKALHIKTLQSDSTGCSNNIHYLNSWKDFSNNREIVIYSSNGEIISDSFSVLFSIMNLDPQTVAGTFSGRIIWTLTTKL